MNSRNAPLSPVSVGGSGSNHNSDWSTGPKYINTAGADPYSRNNRGVISPPDSATGTGTMNGFPNGPRSAAGPSPPPSIARSSTYANSVSGRLSTRDDDNAGLLGMHYVALKKYLQSPSADGRVNPPPNRARDKLLRLSPVQFLELSTDVYDELIRRQNLGKKAPGVAPPAFLQPEDNFHPKRNQARQKLSTLGSPRFRDLATDVFCELERRFPGFAGGDIPRLESPGSVRPPLSRTGTPVNGMIGLPPRGASRARRPSDADSVRSAVPRGVNDFAVPPSPGMPPTGFDRPQQKQFQSNTIVPNKSTMVEEDDNDENESFARTPNGMNGKNDMGGGAVTSEADRKRLEESQAEIRGLQTKLDYMEDQLKRKDEEMNRLREDEQARASASNLEVKQSADSVAKLQRELADARDLNETMRGDLERMGNDHQAEARDLREQLREAQQAASSRSLRSNDGDARLRQENDSLRASLQEQQQATDEVRREAQQFLQEMKMLSEVHTPVFEKSSELEKIVDQLEQEVRDWRNRYARTKTQLRNLRANSLGLTIEQQDAAQYVREKGFTQENGLVKDVHVTKFQIAIDELLQKARADSPEKVLDSMKLVVVGVRRIIKDIDETPPKDEASVQQQQKMKSKVSATANNLITSAKNYAASAGISPVSLIDAAASHLVAAVVDMLKTVKIRATPVGELEDDDDGSVTPVDSTGFFSNRSTRTQQDGTFEKKLSQDPAASVVPPPRFQGLGPANHHTRAVSGQSSAYSPVSSPRQSGEAMSSMNGPLNGAGGGGGGGSAMGFINIGKPPTNGYGALANPMEELKIYLEDQTAVLVETIQGLVASIRGDAPMDKINDEINSIANVVGKIIGEAQSSGTAANMLSRLSTCRDRLLEAGDHGLDLAARGLSSTDREWRMWTQTLPPIAFELARETKELVQRVDRLVMGAGGADDFS